MFAAPEDTQEVFEMQPDVDLSQANPVQDTWYTVIDTSGVLLIYYIAFHIDDTAETLEWKITIDGEETTDSYAALADSGYTLHKNPKGDGFTTLATTQATGYYPSLICGSLKVELRKTTNNGNGNLNGHITYGKQ